MKKILCLLLALLMLMLVSCQASTDDGADKSTAESVPEKATPWSELKTLLGNVDPMVEMPTAFKTYSELSASSSGSGTYAMSMTMMGNTQASGAGFSMDGSLMKVETTVDLDGLSIPVITWMDGAESYIQYPTLYPDVVFPSEEDASSATGSAPTFGSLDISALPQQMISMLEEVATPDKDMTVAEADGMLTYTLLMDAEAGDKLFDELEKLLSGIDTSSLMGNAGDILGQTGSEGTTEEEEIVFDSAVFTVVTDQNVTLNYCLQKLQGETVVESIRLDTLASETNILYAMEKKVGETVETAMTVDVTESAITIKGTTNSDASTKLVVDIAFTAVSDTALSLSGTMNIDMVQGTTSLSIPVTLDGAISVTGGAMDMDLNMSMKVMGFDAKVVLSYDMTFSDITLELPPVGEFDQNDFYEKLAETYPEYFAS